MAFYIAVDAGGTKTDIVLFDENGNIWEMNRKQGCNPLDLGPHTAEQRLEEMLVCMLERSPGPVEAIFGGVAATYYVGDRFNQYLRERIPVKKLRIDDDGCNLITGTLGRGDGCGMVCGTGSALFGRIGGNTGHDLIHIGGYGWLIYTGGSGFELGKEALKAAFRARDGLGPKTILTELLAKDLGADAYEKMPEIYQGGRAFIASFAHTVFEGFSAGDDICREIFEAGSYALAELTWAAEKYFDDEFPVVMGGGIFSAYPEYVEAVKEKASKRARMIPAAYPPVLGAALEALWEAGKPCAEDFRQRFLADYAAWKRKLDF